MTRITIRWDPSRPAKLIHRGSEVSEIEWTDDRTRQCVANEHIIVEGEP
jgi:hypothetical protein